MTRTARCACDRVQLTVEGEPQFVLICHCDFCQRRSGNVFIASAHFAAEQILDISGDTTVYNGLEVDGVGAVGIPGGGSTTTSARPVGQPSTGTLPAQTTASSRSRSATSSTPTSRCPPPNSSPKTGTTGCPPFPVPRTCTTLSTDRCLPKKWCRPFARTLPPSEVGSFKCAARHTRTAARILGLGYGQWCRANAPGRVATPERADRFRLLQLSSPR